MSGIEVGAESHTPSGTILRIPPQGCEHSVTKLLKDSDGET